MSRKSIPLPITCCLFSLFILQVTAFTCDFDVKLSQALHNEGFHRNMTYEILFNTENGDSNMLYSDCIVGLDQPIPAGVYVNPDEINDFKKQKRINAIAKKRVNVELPTEKSTSSNVFLIGVIRDNKAYLWVPVHARYHAARAEGGMVRNTIKEPKLYLRCPDQRLNKCQNVIKPTMSFLCTGSSKEKCSWKKLPFMATSDTLIWEVPVGNTDHYYLVASVTSLVIVIGSLYLLKTIHEYKVALKKKV